MLGKLLKHELKNTGSVMSILYAVLIAVTALGMLILFFGRNKSINSVPANPVSIITSILYILSIVVLFIVICVYLSIRFYKTMYSYEGYLTHTLPVTPLATFHTKLFVSFVWMLLTIFLCILSFFGIAGSTSDWDILKGLSVNTLQNSIQSALGISLGQCAAILLLLIITCCLSFLLFVYASCSIGQLFHQHKIVASVIAGIVLNFIQQIISSIVLLLLIFHNLDSLEEFEKSDSFFSTSMWFGIGISIFFILVYYVICAILVRRHINLE